MQHRKLGLLFFLFLHASIALCSDIRVTNTEWLREADGSHNKIRFTISWDNSWRNDRNYDAAWIFIKYASTSSQGGYRHAKLVNTGHQLIANHLAGSPSPTIEIPIEGTGFFIYASEKYRGRLQWTIIISLDAGILKENNFNVATRLVEIAAIEVVHIPGGPFTIGEADTAAAWKNFALFLSDGNGRPGGPYRIGSEKAINVSRAKADLFYNSQVALYNGDQKGIIPLEFPKGFNAFYIMKYETTQGQYAQFLNTISAGASHERANFGGKDYYTFRGSIRPDKEKYIAGSPGRPNNFFSWDDALAYADWSGLRPITELEFEKACRGPLDPLPNEFPWNSSSKEKLLREVSKQNDELVLLRGLTESDLTESNRDQFGASYYWVMDLAGSLWERCITIGDSTGRSFTGSHGDGLLSGYGFANNKDWPKGSTETAGFGFRGGGYYEHTREFAPGSFNPHSPIGNRNFGSWPGGARSIAYGSRFGRTVLAATIVKL